MSELDLMLSRLSRLSEPWAKAEKRREDERDAERLGEVLAESTAGEVAVLRLALARIVVNNERAKTYDGSCQCGGKGCLGHVSGTTKIARAALGLPALPDTPRVETAPSEPTEGDHGDNRTEEQ